ncbi:MAG: hypothetical protein H0S78_07060 [Tissierellales bacterium]|nr:hypothetical protein [Tissierellales bacterium]
MKQIKTKNAVGSVLCHDITEIIKDKKKGVAFKKGHVIKKEDISKLLSLGKENLYIWEKKEGMVHENDAARILCDICKNEYMKALPVHEGKIELKAEINGLFKIDTKKLNKINSLGDMMIATRHGNTVVKKGDLLVGTRVIPLVIEEERMNLAKKSI